MHHPSLRHTASAALVLCSLAGSAVAADGFKVRYPLSGSLGGEIVAPIDNPGFFASVVLTQIELDKLTDDSGNAYVQAKTGSLTTPPIAGAARTASYSGLVKLDLKQKQTNANLIVGYLSEPNFAGGRLALTFNLPYTTRLDRHLTASGATPTLTPLSPALNSPPLPAGTAAAAQAQTQAGFNLNYQAALAASTAAATGTSDGVGDAELTGAWVYRKDDLKVVAGVTLAMPTGRYDANSSINVGYGNFYTLRPGMAVAFNPAPWLTLGLRGSLAFNTRNKDNQVRSGDFSALDLAAAIRTPYGVFGPHVLIVRQFKDDEGGIYGANRFSGQGVGAFYTALIPAIDTAINLAYMNMANSKNALSGSFYQLRVSKAF